MSDEDPPPSAQVHMSIRVPPSLRDRLAAEARRVDRKRSDVVRRLLLEALAAREAKISLGEHRRPE